MSKLMRASVLLCWVISLPGCGTEMPAIKGRVVDMVTGQPIAETDVVVGYFGEVSDLTKNMRGFTHTSSEPYCAATRIAKSNAKGEFSIQAFQLNWGVYKMRYIPIAYKEGYRAEYVDRYPIPEMRVRLLQDSMVNDYDEHTARRRDYSEIHGQTIKEYQEKFLIPYAYLSEIINGKADSDAIFRGCREERSDRAINALAEHLILKWIDDAPIDDRNAMKRASYSCGNAASYARRNPEFLKIIHATPQRSANLKALCQKTLFGEGVYNQALGIK